MAIVAPTYADARDTCIEGESGLLNVLPTDCITAWNRSLGELTLWNGARYKLFSGEEADRLRGPQHHRAWCDELATWADPDTWDQLLFGLRLGENPQAVITTTPRPTPLIRSLVADKRTVLTRGSSYENRANLAPAFFAKIVSKYEGTRLGRQEISAELLEDVPGALWTSAMFDGRRRPRPQNDAEWENLVRRMRRIVVAIDPSGSNGETGDSQGIVVAGLGLEGRAHVLADVSDRLPPAQWARRAVNVFKKFRADRIVAEANFGGAMVEHTIRTVDPSVPVRMVTASRGKIVRAEPVAALYEQGKVSHVGTFDVLEDQLRAMTPNGYEGEGSPDHADALVWALTDLMLGEDVASVVVGTYGKG